MMDHYNYFVHGMLFLEFQNNFVVLHLVHPNLQKNSNLMENEQGMPFQSQAGCTLIFL
jgi:hypothetical protein